MRSKEDIIRKTRIICYWVLPLWLCPWILLAQEPDATTTDSLRWLKEVTITEKRPLSATGKQQTELDTLILQDNATADLSEVLAAHTPIFIKDYGRGSLSTASFRGTSSAHTQVRWNGLNINSPMLGQTDFSLLPMGISDEVTLAHGTSSLSETGGALGGAVLLQNQPQWQSKLRVDYLQGMASFNTWEEALEVGGGNQRWQVSTRLYHEYSANNFRYQDITNPESQPWKRQQNADYTQHGWLQEAYFRPGDHQLWSFQYWYQETDRGIPRILLNQSEAEEENRQSDTAHRTSLKWQYLTANHSLTVQGGFIDHQLEYDFAKSPPRGASADSLIRIVDASSQERSYFQKVAYDWHGAETWELQTSFQTTYDQVQSDEAVSRLGYVADRWWFSGHAALQKQWSQRWRTALLWRQDFVDEVLPPMPSLSVEYLLDEKHQWLLKLRVGQNYHIPTLNDLYWQPGGNADLRPEQSQEVELSTSLAQAGPTLSWQTELSLYAMQVEDWILWLPHFKGYWEPINLKSVFSRGLEWNGQLHWQRGDWQFHLKMRYNLARTTNETVAVTTGDALERGDQSVGKQLPYIPVHSGNVFGQVRWKQLSFQYTFHYYSERFTSSSNDRQIDWWVLQPYFMNDVSVSYQWQPSKRWALEGRLKVRNLFNEQYQTVLWRPMPLRHVEGVVKLSYKIQR